MGTHEMDDYCSYTKAVEFLGDRWCLLLVRQLVVFGPQGFNELVAGLPGHISRSILRDRLRRLEEIGLVSRAGGGRGRLAPYQLTDGGMAFAPTVLALRGWAETWLPTDPALVERDPSILVVWMGERLDRSRLPDRQVVLELTLRHDPPHHGSGLVHRVRHRTARLPGGSSVGRVSIRPCRRQHSGVVMAIAQGHRDPVAAMADGSIEAFGDPALVKQLPSWFLPGEQAPASNEIREPTRETPALVG